MIRYALIAAVLAAPAFAQDNTAVATSGSGVSFDSNMTANSYVGGTTNNTDFSKAVPSVSAPGIITAHNCAMGVSAGGSGAGFGISFGGTYIDENCETISQAAALNTLAGKAVAMRHLAQIPEVCVTLRASGSIPRNSVCGGDKPAATPQRVATAAPAAANTAAGYDKCGKNAQGQVVIRYTFGADKAAAQAACLATLGY